MDKRRLQYGLWPSPVSAEMLAQSLQLEELVWTPDGEQLLWLEVRDGRGVVVCYPAAACAGRDLTDAQDVRGKVGYRGGALSASAGCALYAESDGRIYRQPIGSGEPRGVTPAFGCAASPTASPDGRWLLYVHAAEGEDVLALCDVGGQRWPQRVARGADFYMQPCWAPNGGRIAWIEWDHPQMPWDGTRLQIAEVRIDDGHPRVGPARTIAGGPETSIFQPLFSPDGRYLAYVSDRSGWYELHLHDLARDEQRQLTEQRAELGMPAWQQGMRSYGFAPGGDRLFALENRDAFARLLQVELGSGEAKPVAGLEEYTALAAPAICPRGERVALIGHAPSIPPRVIIWEDGRVRVLRHTTTERIAPQALARPESVQWQQDGQPVHGLLYRPASATHEGAGGLPPGIVIIHGGPTSQALAGYDPKAQFFATRGYAVLQVNHRGSSGYGRAYRQALTGQWGVFDAEDAVGGHRYLASQKIADPQRIAITGGSAGGYTVLRALTAYPGTFAAGLSLYGISDLFALAAETHKFEARYLDGLIGPLPEASEVYRERSPLYDAERITDPIAIFQGAEDKVVPPNQAERIVASLRERGVPHEYHLYPGEGHGWRKPETIRRHWHDVERFVRQQLLYR